MQNSQQQQNLNENIALVGSRYCKGTIPIADFLKLAIL